MAKRTGKKSKVKKATRAKPRAAAKTRAKAGKKSARAKKKAGRAKQASRAKARPQKPTKVGSAFQIMIDTINETERIRTKLEPRGSDETE